MRKKTDGSTVQNTASAPIVIHASELSRQVKLWSAALSTRNASAAPIFE